VCLQVLLLAATCLSGAEAGKAGRYLAVFADGQRVEGTEVTGWPAGGASVRMDETALLDPKRPLRWLRDRSLQPWDPGGGAGVGFVEFVGGDRLAGRISGVEPSRPGRPARLRVHLAESLTMRSHTWRNPIRVSPTDVRRVVWGRQVPRAFSPMTLFLRDGSRLRFISMGWTNAGVRLLLADGVRVVPFEQAAELHLRPGDPWDAYCRELAVLSPDCSGTLVRIETASGMILTGSADRFRAFADGRRKDMRAYGYFQPAWASDAVCVPLDTIRTWWHFVPHEVPLTRLAPVRTVQRSMTGYRWRPRRNLNVAGGSLIAGGKLAGWGLGVHAHSELIFELPAFVESFRTRVGLDASVGTGGCARAMVYVNAAKGKPLFRSDVLVGSAGLADTGDLKLPAAGEDRRHLVLVADAAHADRPAGADPLDIRDMVNWTEPVLHLNRAALRAEVARRVPTVTMPALQGWAVATAGGMAPIRSQWYQIDKDPPRCISAVSTGGTPLALSRKVRIAPARRWLKLRVRQVGTPVAVGCVDVRVDGRVAARIPVNHGNSDLPYVLSLAAWHGKQVDLRVVYTPGAPDEHVQFRALALADRTTDVNWVPLRTIGAISQNGGGLTVRPDGSIFAAGGSGRVGRLIDTYSISALTDLPHVTAIRVEALPDSTFSGAGPGRWGNAKLTQIRLSTLPGRRKTLRGRYVRIVMPHPRSVLCLGEVEVFAPGPDEKALRAELPKRRPYAWVGWPEQSAEDVLAILKTPVARRSIAQRVALRGYLDTITENIALNRMASQSSTEGEFKADRAVNGTVRWSHAQTEVQDAPWWQVDLGAERPIDRIVVWNHVEIDQVQNLRNFDVVLLDKDGREVWRRRNITDPPVPAVEIFDSDTKDIPVVRAAEVAIGARQPTAAQALDSSREGWCVYDLLGRARTAVFALDAPVDVRRTGLRIDLKFAEERWYQTFGRFRLLATGDEPPQVVEPVAVVIRPPTRPIPSQVPAPPQSPLALFEDDGRFEPVAPAGASKIALISDDKHAVKRAVRIAPGGTYRLAFGRVVPIRAVPGPGEFRYIRFAFRKVGGGTVSLELEHLGSPGRPCRYEAGDDTPSEAFARSVWRTELPGEWIVIDRDIRLDFGRLDLTGLTVGCAGGTHVVLDHVYLARTLDDFKRLPPAPSPKETNDKARHALVKDALAKALAATVLIDADGQKATGVLVGDDGWVATAGHLIVGVGTKVTIRMRDGRVVRGRAAGIEREADVGLIKILDKGTWRGLKICTDEKMHSAAVYAGVSFAPSHDEGKTPLGYVATAYDVGYHTARMTVRLPYAMVGGPLLTAKGELVGIHHEPIWMREYLHFTNAYPLAKNWDTLTQGELRGRWLADTGPMMGIHTTARPEGCVVLSVYSDMPAAAAGLRTGDIVLKVEGQAVRDFRDVGRAMAHKDPGDSVTIEVKRGEETSTYTVPLVRRRYLPPRPPWKPPKK